MAEATRLDVAMMERGLARSRSLARKLVEDRLVMVDGKPAGKASQPVDEAARITLAEHVQWASRAAFKLLGALDELGWQEVPARVLDAGASTGGFTEVLLSRGATQVYAVDVGHGQLVDALRNDPRVHVREGLNLRELDLSHLDGRCVDLVVCDVSFISLKLLLQQMLSVLGPGGRALLMVKPQFEVGRRNLTSSGVVRDEQMRLDAVQDVVDHAAELGWRDTWRAESRLPGPAGNIEHFVLFERA